MLLLVQDAGAEADVQSFADVAVVWVALVVVVVVWAAFFVAAVASSAGR